MLSWTNPSKCAPNLRELRGEFPEFGSKFPMSEWNFPFEPFPHNIREIEALMGMKEDYRRVGERKRDGNRFTYGKGKSGEDKGKFMYLALNCREIETIDVSTL